MPRSKAARTRQKPSGPYARNRHWREFFNEYGDRHGNKKLSWRDDQQRFRDYLLPALGKRKLSGIDRAMIARMLSDAEKAGKSAGTVRQIRALASNMLSKAVEWGYLDANPAQSVKVSGSDREARPFPATG